MNNPPANMNRQSGIMLLEALISILIFSLGILAIVGLQAASISNASQAKYRTDASLLANELIAQMWASDRTQATLQANYSGMNGAGGASYIAWLNSTICPAAASAPALPGIDCTNNINMPTVAISAVTATVAPSNVVTISIFWKSPDQKPGDVPHEYDTVAQIIK
jgi:type IV pilus assembly protein PilV